MANFAKPENALKRAEDLGKYVDEFNHVSRLELEKIRACSPNLLVFETQAKYLNQNRGKVKDHGRSALQPGPLFHIISVRIQPEIEQFSVYGSIQVDDGMFSSYIYKRDPILAEMIYKGSDPLTLNAPDFSCLPCQAFTPMLRGSKMNVMLYDTHAKFLLRGSFPLDNTTENGDYSEQVKTTCFKCDQGSIRMKYIAIPLGIYCRVSVTFHNRPGCKKYDFMDVYGKMVARCGGESFLEESVLFDQKANESQKVKFDGLKVELSRCWVALPAYSSLVIGLDMSEFQTGRKIVQDTVELLPHQGLMTGDSFVLSDMIIEVSVAWFSPTPFGPNKDYDKCSTRGKDMPTTEVEDMDMDMDIGEESEPSSDEESSYSFNIPPFLRPHKIKPLPLPAVEIFSVSIGREKSKALGIHGSIELLSDEESLCYAFKRGENEALWLLEGMNSTPIFDDGRAYEYCKSLEMKIDLKSTDGNLTIKGYVDWADSILDSNDCDTQLCSFIQGQNGFAAIHYSVFSNAVAAVVGVFLKPKMRADNSRPNVYGSLTSQLRYYNYSSTYNQNYYRSKLFAKSEEHAVQLNDDESLPLSRSLVIVPYFSSLILNADLLSEGCDEKFMCVQEIGIGHNCERIETKDWIVHFKIDWSEIK